MKAAVSKPKAYSYLRFSTPEQIQGDSFRRQTALAEAWATRNGLELDGRSYQDLGVSAYRGANAETGMLGEFLQAVRAGAVERGSYLLIESLDRLSRNKPRKAVRLLESICEEGITLVTLADGKVYTEEVLDDDPMAFMWAFMVAIRANEESAMKARRLKAAWQGKRERAREKPLTSVCPAWLRLDKASGEFVLQEERAAIVRRVFDLMLSGVRQNLIAETLNREGVPRFGKGMHWHRSYIKKLSENPAVVGTLVPHETVHENGKAVRKPLAPIEGYYPAVIDNETFQQVQALRVGSGGVAVNRTTKTGGANLLAGLGRCPVCSATMTRVSKGARKKAGRPYYVCARAKVGAGCSYHAVKQDVVEHALVRDAPAWTANIPVTDESIDKELLQVLADLEAVEEAIQNVVAAISEGASTALSQKLRALEDEKESLERRRQELWERASASDRLLLEKRLIELRAALAEPSLDKPKANTLLRQVLASVTIDYVDGDLLLEWKNGGISQITFGWSEP